MSNNIAREATKDRLLGYVSPSNHPYRLHAVDGVNKPSNCDRFIRETGKGVVSVGNVWDIDWTPVKPFIGHSGRIREMLENMRQPLLPGPVYGG